MLAEGLLDRAGLDLLESLAAGGRTRRQKPLGPVLVSTTDRFVPSSTTGKPALTQFVPASVAWVCSAKFEATDGQDSLKPPLPSDCSVSFGSARAAIVALIQSKCDETFTAKLMLPKL